MTIRMGQCTGQHSLCSHFHDELCSIPGFNISIHNQMPMLTTPFIGKASKMEYARVARNGGSEGSGVLITLQLPVSSLQFPSRMQTGYIPVPGKQEFPCVVVSSLFCLPAMSTGSSTTKDWIQRITAAACGVGFGFFLHKAAVFDPKVISDQFVLSNFTMLKTFLSAVSVSLLANGVMSCFPSSQKQLNQIRPPAVKRSLSSVSVGAGILGFGMALAGTCPGTVSSYNFPNHSLSSLLLNSALVAALSLSLCAQLVCWAHMSIASLISACKAGTEKKLILLRIPLRMLIASLASHSLF